MSKRLMLVLAVAGVVAAITVPAIATSHGPVTNARILTATVTGDGETTPVDSDGVGVVTVTIDVRKRVLCYDVSITGMDPVAIHIHEGAAGVDGGVVVDFSAFGDPIAAQSEGCTRTPRKKLLRAIKDNPRAYYINVHSAAYPGGELRGQLDK